MLTANRVERPRVAGIADGELADRRADHQDVLVDRRRVIVGHIQRDAALVAEARIDLAGLGVQGPDVLPGRIIDARRMALAAGPIGNVPPRRAAADLVTPDDLSGFGLQRDHRGADRIVHHVVDHDRRRRADQRAAAMGSHAQRPRLGQPADVPCVDLVQRREARRREIAGVARPVGRRRRSLRRLRLRRRHYQGRTQQPRNPISHAPSSPWLATCMTRPDRNARAMDNVDRAACHARRAGLG